MKARKRYTFRRSIATWRVVADIDNNSYHLSESTYNRFVRLANSGNYAVEILDADYGVAWQMQRKAA